METLDEVVAVPDVVREQYLSAIADLQERYRRELRLAGIDYVMLDTSVPLETALMSYLMTRRRSILMVTCCRSSIRLFLLGALAIAIPIVLHLFRRRTEARRRISGGAAAGEGAGRAAAAPPAPRADPAGAARRGARVAGVGIRASVLRSSGRRDSSTGHGGRPRHVLEPVGAWTVRRRATGSAPCRRERARHTCGRPRHLRRCSDHRRCRRPRIAADVLQAIDARHRTAGGTRYPHRACPSRGSHRHAAGRIVVVTDLQQAGWEAGDEGAVPDGIDVEIVGIAPPEGNVAVTAARRDGAAIVAAIHNFGSRPARVPVRLRVDDRDLSAQPVDIAPQAAAEIRLAVAAAATWRRRRDASTTALGIKGTTRAICCSTLPAPCRSSW